MNNTRTTSPSPLLRMRNHRDQDAWQNFCRVYYSWFYGYCRNCKLDANDAADGAPSKKGATSTNRNLDFVYTLKNLVLKRPKLEVERLVKTRFINGAGEKS